MQKSNVTYGVYCEILNKELIVALGCTEPIALAYAAAKARQTLNAEPVSVVAEVCGNVIKNAKSVIVPNTDGQKGIQTAVAAGVLFGNPDKQLQVLTDVKAEQKPRIKDFAESGAIKVVPSSNPKTFYIKITVSDGLNAASVTIEDNHTNVTDVSLNGKSLFLGKEIEKSDRLESLYRYLSVEDIVDFADTFDLNDLKQVLDRQITVNTAISREGLCGDWGASIGKIIAKDATDAFSLAIAAAAAGSDARMSGCELPVVIVSGSGNQGMTASIPVITYANGVGAPREKLLRALVIANLMTIHQKTGIGKLSAYCGAVSAGVGAACGIAYLDGGGFDAIAHTAVNALAIDSGIVCDGAKPSCAGKIATSLFTALLGYKMYLNGQEFVSGEGIVKKGVDNTIASVSRLASLGMKETDKEIIKIMTE